MMDFGYLINQPRTVDIDANDMSVAKALRRLDPLLESCVACGGCAATCTAGNYTSFNLRKMHTMVRRGEYDKIYDELSKCMLCGKCRMVCPRGINTRGAILIMKKQLENYKR